jgi:tRNA-Thr(GGU) m(6)t(6)A37 methyltransferase TsaA
MDDYNIIYRPIGIIHTPFKSPGGIPIQPCFGRGIKGHIEIFDEYCDGLKDLDGFSHIILLYHFHLSSGYSLQVIPFLDSKSRGVFATRAPKRPNPIGLSVVKLEKIEGNTIHVEDIDIVDGTPLIDIKPYISDFDFPSEHISKGWFEKAEVQKRKGISDGRFLSDGK